MKEYYMRDRVTGAIVNCVTTQKSLEELRESPYYETDEYYLDPNPPLEALMKYKYWNERS
jgi:hypothetical protein